jgi:hypothetical protein
MFLQMMLGNTMQQNIQMRTNMQMAQLQRPCQGKNQRHVFLLFFFG